jgi:hypothetical protein
LSQISLEALEESFYFWLSKFFLELGLDDLLKDSNVVLKYGSVLQLVLFTVLEGILILFKELVLGLSELLLSHDVSHFVEDCGVFILRIHFIIILTISRSQIKRMKVLL